MNAKDVIEQAARRAADLSRPSVHSNPTKKLEENIRREFDWVVGLIEAAQGTIAALDSLLCVECGYRIGWAGNHGDLGRGYNMDWRDCRICHFSRETLAEAKTIVAAIPQGEKGYAEAMRDIAEYQQRLREADHVE